MFKYIKFFVLSLLFSASFSACSDDEDYYYDEGNNSPSYSSDEVYALIQGNLYGGVGGAIDKLLVNDNSQSNVVKNYFTQVNQQELGDGPQEGLRYGTRIYVSVQGSNRLWVLDAATLKIQHEISMSQPTALCATQGYVFATNYDGHVTRVDTFYLEKQPQTLAVGPNPDGIAAFQDKVYVTISDGMNYENGYANGKKVVELQATDFVKSREYSVGLNPGQIVCNRHGEVFLVTRGDYAQIPPMVQKILPNGEVTDYEPGNLIAVDGDMLYIVDSQVDWSSADPKALVKIKRFNMTDDTCEENYIAEKDLPANPTHIDVHPATHDLYISSDKSPSGATLSGWVYRYNYGGQLLNRYNVGIHPYGVIFK